MTNRDSIDKLRDYLRERNADSTFSNKFLYSILEEHAKWLIKREAGKIYKSTTLFQPLSNFPIREVPTIDGTCGIDNCLKIFRTEDQLPESWEDSDGYIIKDVTSIDDSASFQSISPVIWRSVQNHPYYKYNKTYYYYIKDRYMYFPMKAPRQINLLIYAKRDVSNLGCCGKELKCIRLMDDKFRIPDWIEAELFSKALTQLAGITERLQDDNQIDKNTLRKGQSNG